MAVQSSTGAPQAAASVGNVDFPDAKDEAIQLIDSAVANGLMSEADADFLKTGINGGEGNFSSANGFLNNLVELLKFAADNNSQITLVRFEIIDNKHAAEIDAAQEALDGAKMGFVVSVAGAAASLGVGAYGGKAFTSKQSGEADTSMAGVMINLSSQISQSVSTWVDQTYQFQAAEDRADAEQYGSLLQSQGLNEDLTSSILQAIAGVAR